MNAGRITFLLLLCALLFFNGLGARDLHSSHEARAAQDAQMILSGGDWLLPGLFDRRTEMQKPPLYYWLVAFLAHCIGGEVDVWAVRLPAAFSALGCVFFLYFLGCKRAQPLAGFLAALILATSLHFTWLARVGRIDMPLTLAVTVAAGCFLLGKDRALEGRGGLRWFLLGYLAVAVGVLLKGPIAAVFAFGITGAHGLAEHFGRAKAERMPRHWGRSLLWGVPLVCACAGPWFLYANIETGGRFWKEFFWYHNLERGLGNGEHLASHPFWFYLPRALLDLLPWSLCLPGVIWLVRKEGWSLLDRTARFGAIWFGVVFLFLSLMRFKRADYLLPAFPGAALFLGSVAARWWQQVQSSAPATPAGIPIRRKIATGLLGSTVALMCAGWLIYGSILTPAREADWPYQKLAHDIRRQTHMPVIFFRAEAHLLAFHVGRPLDTILEWENLEAWACKGAPVYFVMPADCADCWPDHLTNGKLEEVFRTSDQAWGKAERPLVVLRSVVRAP